MRRTAHSGFTLIELAIVLSIVAILAIMAMPSLNAMMPRFRLNRTVKEFVDNVQLMRLMAISQNREFRVCLDLASVDGDVTNDNIRSNSGKYTLEGGDQSSGSETWDILPMADGGDDASDEGTFVLTWSANNRTYAGVSITGWTSMTGPNTGNTNCIVFSPRGWISNPAADFSTNGYMRVYFRNKAANPENDSRSVLISRGGLARIRVGD